MNKKFLICFVFISTLTGCVTTQSISSADKVNVRAVVVDKTVTTPEKMYYLGPGGAAGLVFGAIGGALSASGIEDSRSSFQKEATGSEEAIRTIVAEELVARIRESGKFPVIDSVTPDAKTIHFSVVEYGFSIPHGFSSKLVPILYIKCEMKDASGRVLWTGADRTMPLGNPVEAVDAETIRKDSAARDSAWRAAAKALAKNIVDGY